MTSPLKKPRVDKTYLRPNLVSEKTINLIESYVAKKFTENDVELKEIGVEIIKVPYTVLVIRNFISDPKLLKSVIHDFNSVDCNDKSNDLYQFKQSDDLSNLNSESFKCLHDCIKYETRFWVGKLFGNIKLKETVSATFSCYSYQDRLLCHDDKCGDRHIAFILYLVEDWKEEDGGILQLFSADCEGYPDKIIKSLCPQYNTLILFEVSHTSFHQVSEVLTKSKKRLSLNGWFHLLDKTLEFDDCKLLKVTSTFGNDENYALEDYFLNTYFNNNNLKNVQKLFSNNSEIQLDNFLLPKLWHDLTNDLNSKEVKWIRRGPQNVRNYEVIELSTLTHSLQTIKNIFESKSWFKFLKTLTSLDFAPSNSSDLKIWESGILPQCYCEIQKWAPSSYTLIHDKDSDFHCNALDVILRVPCQQKDTKEYHNADIPEAGHLIYIDAEAKNEECLLHIGYKMNSLSFVYRDNKTLRFTKYLHSESQPYYQIFCTYYPWKPPTNQPNLKHCEEDESSSEDSFRETEEDIYLSDE